MGHFVRGTKRIELGIHSVAKKAEWWEVKLKLSVGDRTRIQDELLDLRIGAIESGPDDKIYMMRALGAVRKVATVDWRLFDDDGKVVPFERELIDELDPDDPIVQKIDDAIGALNLNPFGMKRESKPLANDTTEESSSTPKSKTAKAAESS